MSTKITVNGVDYDSADAMPPDVRQIYDQAMRVAAAGGPAIRKSEIKLSFQMTGPHFKFRVGSGTASASAATSLPSAAAQPVSATEPRALMDSQPIEPSSGGGAFRIALALAACVATGLGLWIWMRAH